MSDMKDFDKLYVLEKLYETEEPSLAEKLVWDMNDIIAERNYLRKENIELKRQLKFYRDNVNQSLEQHKQFMGELLTSLIKEE